MDCAFAGKEGAVCNVLMNGSLSYHNLNFWTNRSISWLFLCMNQKDKTTDS